MLMIFAVELMFYFCTFVVSMRVCHSQTKNLTYLLTLGKLVWLCKLWEAEGFDGVFYNLQPLLAFRNVDAQNALEAELLLLQELQCMAGNIL